MMTLEPSGYYEPPAQDDRCGRCGKEYGEHREQHDEDQTFWLCADGPEFEPRDADWEAARDWDAACERAGV